MLSPYKSKRISFFPLFSAIFAIGLAYLTYGYFEKHLKSATVKKFRQNLAPVQNFLQSDLPNAPLPPHNFPIDKNSKSFIAPPSSAPPSFQLAEGQQPISTAGPIDEKLITAFKDEKKLIENHKNCVTNEKSGDNDSDAKSPNPKFLDYVGYCKKHTTSGYQHPPKYNGKNFGVKISKIFNGPLPPDEKTAITVDDNFKHSASSEISQIANFSACTDWMQTAKKFPMQISFKFRQIWPEFLQYFTFSQNVAKIFIGLIDDRPVWFWTMLCSMAVMLTGVIPAFLIPARGASTKCTLSPAPSISPIQLNRLLCFAVGTLLGDVFFHLLPESWSHTNFDGNFGVGLWVIAGLISCLVIEKFCSHSESSQHYVAAMANLVANVMDNFTHGLAVGGSFLVSKKLGFITTFAIMLHEIPHEISDFAILLRADFDRKSAIKAQFITAFGGVIGAAVALITEKSSYSNIDQGSSWILPFSAGGFLNIALIQLLPDLLKERSTWENFIQFVLIAMGISTMGLLNASIHV